MAEVGEYAIAYSGLVSFAWPVDAVTIAFGAFYGTSSLGMITGLGTIVEVREWAFYLASSLPHVYLPPGCTVANNAFDNGPAGYSTTEHSFYGTHAP